MSEYVFYVDGVPPKKDSVDYNNLYLVFMDTASGSIGSGNLASQIDVDIDDIEVYCVSQFKGDLQRSQGVVIASQGFSGSSLSGAYGIASPAQIPNFSVLSLAMDTDATLEPGLYEMFAYFSASGVGSLGAGSPQFYKSGQILLACSDTKFLSNGVNTALASNENSQWVDLPLDYNNIPSTAGHTGSGVNQLANSAFTAVDVYMGNIVSLGSQGAQMTYKRIVFKVLRRTAVFPQLYDLRGRVQSNTGYSLTSYIRRIG